MVCKKCGTKIENGAKFCTGCGQELNVAYEQNETEKDSAKGIPKKILFGAIGAVAVIIAIICITVNAGPTINFDEYVTIEASGYENYGRVTAVIDWASIEEKYGEKLSYTDEAREVYGFLLDYTTPVNYLKDVVTVQFSEQNHLSNGDKVEYTWDIDENVSLYLNCKVKSKDGTYKVSSLEEIETFDAFADLTVTFEGISPNGRVVYKYSGEQLGYYDFSCDKKTGLSNGDTVTVSITESDEYLAALWGMVPSKLENEYVVSGLQEYVASYSDLSSDFIETLKNDAINAIHIDTSSYASDSNLSDLKYEGYIYNYINDTSLYSKPYNSIYIIYSGTVSSSTEKFPDTTVYFPVQFTNILNSDGNITYGQNNRTVGFSRLGDTPFCWTVGYVDPSFCYKAIIAENADSYITEVGDGFEAYTESE